MGSKVSKEPQSPSRIDKSASSPSGETPQADFRGGGVALKDAAGDGSFSNYVKFRDELLSFSLGESAFDYAERLFKEHPDSKEVMALLAETCVLYDKTKNKHIRKHWVDRMDLLQRGIDVSRKCIKENPEFGPCYRGYVLNAVRASEAVYHYRWMKSVGLMENFKPIMKRGVEAMQLCPEDPDVPSMLGSMCSRIAYSWYNPYRIFGRMYEVPPKQELYKEAIKFLTTAQQNDPGSLEISFRLGQAYHFSGDFANARRQYCRVRDEMTPRDLHEEKWQGLAHTELTTGLQKTKWNVPFA
jgi:tetratricopeptide (TPR) repeat protein